MKNLVLAFTLILSTTVFACSEDGKSGFVEENDLFIPVDSFRMGGLSEEQFNNVIDRVEAIYMPIATNLGKKLKK